MYVKIMGCDTREVNMALVCQHTSLRLHLRVINEYETVKVADVNKSSWKESPSFYHRQRPLWIFFTEFNTAVSRRQHLMAIRKSVCCKHQQCLQLWWSLLVFIHVDA